MWAVTVNFVQGYISGRDAMLLAIAGVAAYLLMGHFKSLIDTVNNQAILKQLLEENGIKEEEARPPRHITVLAQTFRRSKKAKKDSSDKE